MPRKTRVALPPPLRSFGGISRCWLLAMALVMSLAGWHARAASIIASNGTWKYFPGTSEASNPTNLWRMPEFDDSAWLTGAAPLHYGTNAVGGDDFVTWGTVLSGMSNNYSCVFMRGTFVIPDSNSVLALTLGFVKDDGLVVFLNGTVVRAVNAPAFLGYTNTAPSSAEANQVGINDLSPYFSSLRSGTNVLAVQAFNQSRTNDDFRIAVWLDGTLKDSIPPTLTNATPLAGSSLGSLTTITVVFDEPVQGVDAGDLLVNQTPALSVAGGLATNTYVFTFAQPLPGQIAVEWSTSHGITDLTGNAFDENLPGASWIYNLVDNAPPVTTTITPVPGATLRNLTQVEVAFSEPVQGVEASDLRINGVPATSASGFGAGPYLFSFPQPAAGTVQFAWAPGHGIADLASPPNAFGGGTWSVTLNPAASFGDVVINEFLAANISTNGLRDENGELEDWIELFNRGTNAVNLAGWSLSDDANNPGQWTFPATNIGPGGFLLVWASAKDRRVPGAPLHTTFKLSPSGEYLGLFSPELPRLAVSEFRQQFPEQRNDYSYGYTTTNALRYFAAPTPGATNGSSVISNVLTAPHFNVARGLYDQPFALTISAPDPGATIRYTVDGSEPTESSGAAYTGTLTISNTTTLRAAAFRTNALPSATVTHTYLFIDQVVQQPKYPAGFPTNWGCCGNVSNVSATTTFPPGSTVPGVIPADYEMDPDPLRVDPNNTNSPIDTTKLQRLKDGLREIPTVSVVMKQDDIYGIAGLFQRSARETGTAGTKPDNKKPCSIEMILPDGTTAFATTCGIDLHGNASRNPIKNPKHGFKLNFRGDFGPTTLNYPLFEDSAIEEYDDILMRADFNSSWRHWSDSAGQSLGAFQRTRATRTRDAWMKEAMRDMGGLASHNRFFHLYLNGLYWGVFEFSEDPTETFARTTLGGTDADFDVVDQGVLKNGTLTAYNAMTALPAATNLTRYVQYFDYLNMTEFIDYMLLHFFIGHQDWSTTVTKNWAAIRKRVPGPEGTFRYIPWDGECILLDENVNRTLVTTPPSGLHTKLDDSIEYRLAFADRVHRHMIASGGALTQPVNSTRWKKWQAILDKPIVGESVRWGDYRRDVHNYNEPPYVLYTRENHWLPENTRMMGYFSNRNAIVLSQLRSNNLYPLVSAPVLNQQGGRVAAGFALTMTATNPIYYTLDGTDPRIFGTGAIAPWAQTYTNPVTLGQTLVIKARARFGTNWSALNEASFTVGELGVPLRFTEINYNPPGGDAYEFFELHNAGSSSIDLGSCYMEGVSFVFPLGTAVPAGGVLVLASSANTNAFKARYPGAPVFGWFSGALNNGGERLAVKNAAGQTIVAVTYSDNNGWPTGADGGGYSLEMVNLSGDPNAPANWRLSTTLYGSPGLLPADLTAPQVVLNEIMADNISAVTNGGEFPDWIELRNNGAAPVALDGWSLTDDGNARRFVFPTNTTLAAGAYLVVWCDTNSAAPGLHTGFALSRDGENVLLYDADTNLIDAVSFGCQVADFTIGRLAGVWQLNTPTPGAANAAATLGSQTNLAVNEWLADAPPGGSDWIELFNRSATAPVALQGIYFTTSNALYQVRSLSYLGPRGFVQFLADAGAGPNHLGFSLPKESGMIALADATGAPIEQVTYGAQSENISQGRLPDGTAAILSFPGSQSPGASNYVTSWSGPLLNEFMARNVAAVNSPGGRRADWVELRNPGASAFDLTGLGLSDSPSKARWTFPAGSSLPAGGHVVVWCDGGLEATTNGGGYFNTGFGLDDESGGLYLFNSAGQMVDSVAYGFQLADRSAGLSGGQWRLLTSPTPGAANAAAATLGAVTNLCLNEWMASPTNGKDWFEIYNRGVLPVDLAGLYLTDDPSIVGITQYQIGALTFIDAGGWVRWLADGDPSQGRQHVTFSLDGAGETVRLYATPTNLIDAANFGWQVDGVSQGRLPDGSSNLVSFPVTASPAAANYLPLTNVVINEVLAHTDPPYEDAVELHNTTAAPVNVGGWYLSDSSSEPKKYRLTNGLVIPAGGFTVLYQYQFDPTPGVPPSFALNSARGDELFLSEADGAGNLTGYRAEVAFGPTANPVSVGRYFTSQGVEFVNLASMTFGTTNPPSLAQFRTGTGASNAPALVGDVVINEIMYHPVSAGSIEDANEEFLELYNRTGSTVPLYDLAHATNRWKVAGGVDFVFPAGTTLGAGQYLLLVRFNPATDTATLAAFRAKYAVPTNVAILGPWSGRLDNAGEAIETYEPDPPQTTGEDIGLVPYVLVERIRYKDNSPWPPSADGGGASLQRALAAAFGNDPTNWFAAAPTAGRANAQASQQPPTIDQAPQSLTVVAGQPASFSVVASGTAPLAYQWQFFGTNLPGATNATFTRNPAQITDAGPYRVLVSNAVDTILSSAATLTVLVPPTVVSLTPSNQLVTVGSNITITAAATGTTPLIYQWLLGTAPVSGQTNAALSLPGAQTSQSGSYRVVVSNAAGAVTSGVATVTVLYAPFITAQPQPQTVSEGSNAVFSVSATGDAPLGYQWYQDGAPIGGANSSSLQLNGVTLADNGRNYTVRVTNLVGTAWSAPATLYVLIQPELIGVRLTGGTLMQFTIAGQAGRSYWLEVSSNLTDWVTIPETTYTSGQTVTVDAAAMAQQFQRLRAVP